MLSVATIFLSVIALAQGYCSPKSIAFTATFAESTKFSANQVVKYNNVITNIGNAFDKNTGTFTAPVDGLYDFHIYLYSNTNLDSMLGLFHNERYIVSAQAWETEGSDSAGNYVVLALKKGDRIQVKAQRDSDILGSAEAQRTTFSGHLMELTSD